MLFKFAQLRVEQVSWINKLYDVFKYNFVLYLTDKERDHYWNIYTAEKCLCCNTKVWT